MPVNVPTLCEEGLGAERGQEGCLNLYTCPLGLGAWGQVWKKGWVSPFLGPQRSQGGMLGALEKAWGAAEGSTYWACARV